jgi:glycolate oxidase
MAITREAYRALEGIVGPENVSEEAVILDSYAFQFMMGFEYRWGGRFCPKPAAVVVPATTEEVQGIVKACNRYAMKFKAFSTGFGFWGAVEGDNVIQIDLRRMNRILEVDEKNMHAVIEPYVSGAQLQTEAMKVGLNTHIVGAGNQHSILASVTSQFGFGASGIYMSFASRNCLGVEWILPSGEILKLGSLGSGNGWFTGDGPGPSLRGVLRGFMGHKGGMGVITKAAVKLYAWPGPTQVPVKGVTPHYHWTLPDNFRCYSVAFPNWEAFREAWYLIGEAEIGYVMAKEFTVFGQKLAAAYIMLDSGLLPNLTIDDIEEVMNTPEAQRLEEELRHSIQITLAGHSQRDIEYQVKVLNEILKRTGGHIIEQLAAKEVQDGINLNMIKCRDHIKIFDFAGSFGTSFGYVTIPDPVVESAPIGEALKKKHIAKGGILDDGGDAMWGGIYEQDQVGGHLEEVYCYDPAVPDSWQKTKEYLTEAVEICQSCNWPMGLGLENSFRIAQEMLAKAELTSRVAQTLDIFRWQQRICRAFDPNSACDSHTYLQQEEE